MSESWFTASRNTVYEKNKVEQITVVITKRYEDIIFDLINASSSYKPTLPLQPDCVNDETFVNAFCKEIRQMAYGTKEIKISSQIQNGEFIEHILIFATSVEPALKNIVYEVLLDMHDSNISNKNFLQKIVSLKTIIDLLIQCPSNTKHEETILKLAFSYAIFNVKKDDILKISSNLLKADIKISKKRLLLKVLNKTCDKKDPNSYYHFIGTAGSGITIPNFPEINKKLEYSISSWFNIRDSPFELVKKEFVKKKDTVEWNPYLFSFSTDEGILLSLYFSLDTVTFEINNGVKSQTYQFSYNMTNNVWHHICITHTFVRTDCKLSLYIDGNLLGLSEIPFPTMKSRFNRCYIGKSARNTQLNQFIGSISSFHVWNIALSADQVSAMHTASQMYSDIYNDLTEYNGFDMSQNILDLFSGPLSYCLACVYLPNSTFNNVCYDASSVYHAISKENYDATHSNDVLVVFTKNVENILRSTGSLSIIYSLLHYMIPENSINPDEIVKLVIELVEMLTKFVSTSNFFNQTFVINNGFELVAWRVCLLGAAVYSSELMECILRCSKIIIESKGDIKIFKQLIMNFIFDTRVWVNWPHEVLALALNYMISERINNQEFSYYLKTTIGVAPITEIIMAYYNDDNTENDKSLSTLKTYLLMLIKQIIVQGSGIQDSEFESALYYFGPRKEEYIYNLVKIMKEAAIKNKDSFGSAFCNLNSILVFNEFLCSKDPVLFEDGLEFFTLVVNYAPGGALRKLIHTYHIWSILTYHLLDKVFTQNIFKYLMRMMIGDAGYAILTSNDTDLAKRIDINKPRIIQVFSWLFHNEMSKCIDDEARKQELLKMAKEFIVNLDTVLKVNPENRNRLFAKIGWQGWVLNLLRLFINHSDYQVVEEHIFSIVLLSILTGIKIIDDGWVIFIDFLGYIHYFSNYKHFDAVTELLRTDFLKTQEIVNNIIPHSNCNTGENNSNIPNDLSENILIKQKKHILNKNMPIFEFDDFFVSMLSYILAGIHHDLSSIANFTHLINDSSSTILLKNLSNIITFISDLLISSFGTLESLLKLATLSESGRGEEINFPLSKITKYHKISSMIDSIYSIFDMIFVSSGVNFKKLEVQYDFGEGFLVGLSYRVTLCKILIDVCVNCFRYWKILAKSYSIQATPLYNMNENVKRFLETQTAIVEKNTKDIAHPLIKKLIQPNQFKFLKEILVRRGEHAPLQHFLAGVTLYALGSVAVSHYKRIIDYKPPNQEDLFKALDVLYFVESSISGVATLIYETLIAYTDVFSKSLVGPGNSNLMDVGFKYMKNSFKPLEFVMLLSSENWRRAIEKNFKPNFDILLTENREGGKETVELIGKHSCSAADLCLYSALFVQQSVYSTSSWKRSLVNLNEMIQSKTNQMKDTAKINERSNHKDLHYSNILKDHVNFTNILILGDIKTPSYNINFQSFKLIDREDDKRRRFYVVGDNYRPAVVTFLKEGETFSKAISMSNPMESIDALQFSEVINVSVSNNNASTVTDATQSESATPITSQPINSTTNTTTTTPVKPLVEKGTDMMKNMFGKLKSIQININKKNDENINEIYPSKWVTHGVCIHGNFIINPTLYMVEFLIDQTTLSPELKQLLSQAGIKNIKMLFSIISRVFLRKYAHQPIGVEIFSDIRKSFYFVFKSEEAARKIISSLPEVGIGSDYGLPSTRESSILSAFSIFERSTLPNIWCRGGITNFEYIMFLNTISGRTYQDIGQYPIFPWILSNYNSESIDLTNRKNYRDLTKPIGTLNVERLAESVERFMTASRADSTPAFHYNKHYSTPDYVTDYLIRLEPFSSIRRYMNGNKLEHPKSSFNSLDELWNKVTSNSNDVRELIPELFYLPEMLSSSREFISAEDNTKVEIKPVQIPPYAKDALDFVTIHAEALESLYVSSTLHKWIDFIFGFQQRGKEAEKIINVFHYLTYDNPILKLKLNNESVKDSISAHIMATGQCPGIIGYKPHPDKLGIKSDKAITNVDKDKYINMFSVTPVHIDASILYIGCISSITGTSLLFISSNLKIVIKLPQIKTSNEMTSVILNPYSMGFIDNITSPALEEKQSNFHFDIPEYSWSKCTSNSFTTTISEKSLLVACPYWDNSFRLYDFQKKLLSQIVHAHQDTVTCIDCDYDSSSRDSVFVVTGSSDSTICLWSYLNSIDCISNVENLSDPTKCHPVIYMYGHVSPVTQVNIKLGIGMIASLSQSNHICMHTISNRLISIFVATDDPEMTVVKIKLTFNGNLVVLLSSEKKSILRLYNKHGVILNQKNIPECLTCLEIDVTGFYCFVSGSRNALVVIKINTLDVAYSYAPSKQKITYIKCMDMETIVVGMTTGEVGFFSNKGWLR